MRISRQRSCWKPQGRDVTEGPGARLQMCAAMRKCRRSVSAAQRERAREMEQKLRLCAFLALMEVSLAVWQRVTAIRGQKVDLRCPVTNAHQTVVDWKTPEGHIMHFAHKGEVTPGVVSERYSFQKLSHSEFTISISDVTFADAGNYTCYEYGDPVTERKVELTVLGPPTIIQWRSKGRFNLKCTAQANFPPPQIIWKLNNGPEILAQSQVTREDKSYRSLAILSIQAVEDKVTVACLVQHPALYAAAQPLVDFVKIRANRSRVPHVTSWPRPHHHTSTQQRTTTERRPSDSSTSAPPTASTEAPPPTSPNVHDHSTTPESSSTSSDEPLHPATSTEGGPTQRKGRKESPGLLVFLVTCLIFALLVVVIFFAIKLRRAHIAWKKENEDSDPSEESSKSKASQEEKKGQGQKSRGLIKTMFTQYVVEDAAVVTSVKTTAAPNLAGDAKEEPTVQPQPTSRTGVTFNVKETDL